MAILLIGLVVLGDDPSLVGLLVLLLPAAAHMLSAISNVYRQSSTSGIGTMVVKMTKLQSSVQVLGDSGIMRESILAPT